MRTLSELASAASSGMLLGARGNSGVILSRIFAGLAKGLKDMVEADTKAFAKAMQVAVDEAYKSVPVPVEGTIITVLREGAAGADACGDLTHYFETLLEAMQTSLDHTPELLPVLKDAGVVDSGGAGLLSIFRGMNDALNGNISDEEIAPTTASTPTVELDKFTENSTLEFGYCTEFLLRLMRSKVDLDTFDEAQIIDYLNKVGESVVAFREGTIIKVHVHTFTPGAILNEMQHLHAGRDSQRNAEIRRVSDPQNRKHGAATPPIDQPRQRLVQGAAEEIRRGDRGLGRGTHQRLPRNRGRRGDCRRPDHEPFNAGLFGCFRQNQRATHPRFPQQQEHQNGRRPSRRTL